MDQYETAPPNRVERDSQYRYAYDDEGNLTQRWKQYEGADTGWRTFYEYDHRNRLIEVEEVHDDSVILVASYRYDAAGNLAFRQIDEPFDYGFGQPEHYVVENGRRTMTLDENDDVVRRAAYGPTGEVLFDQLFDALGQETDSLLPMGDHQNSTRLVAGPVPSGNLFQLRQRVDYAPFGRVTAIYDENGQLEQFPSGAPDLDALDTVFGHHGSVLDAKTELQHKGARWYSPDLGRFISEDPAQDGANWYAFAGNDPVNYGDPTGLSQAGHPLQSTTFRGFTAPSNLNLSLGAAPRAHQPLANNVSLAAPAYNPAAFYGPVSGQYAAPALSAGDFDRALSRSSALASLSQPQPLYHATSDFTKPPRPPRVARVEQLGTGSPEGWFTQKAVEQFSLAMQETDPHRASVYNRAAQSYAIAGAVLDLLPSSTPSYNVTYDNGSNVHVLGGDVADTGAGMSLLLPLAKPLSAGKRAAQAARPSFYQVADEGIDLTTYRPSSSWEATPGQVGRFSRTTTPWERNVWQRPDIDWSLQRPDGLTNLEAAQQGYTPMRQIGETFEKVQLHHLNQNPTGSLAEVWQSTHHRMPHNVPPPSWRVTDPAAARAFNREVPTYWQWRVGGVGGPQ